MCLVFLRFEFNFWSVRFEILRFSFELEISRFCCGFKV
jgi:hypothetical protein